MEEILSEEAIAKENLRKALRSKIDSLKGLLFAFVKIVTCFVITVTGLSMCKHTCMHVYMFIVTISRKTTITCQQILFCCYLMCDMADSIHCTNTQHSMLYRVLNGITIDVAHIFVPCFLCYITLLLLLCVEPL